jgi:hypothetical protein
MDWDDNLSRGEIYTGGFKKGSWGPDLKQEIALVSLVPRKKF